MQSTEPGVKGDTVSNVTKPAMLETGATVQVPLFVNEGERVKVDTRDGRYLGACLSLDMTRFVDTTLRLLSQDPLARTLSTAHHPAPRRGRSTRWATRARGLRRRLLHDRRRARRSRARGSGSARCAARTRTPLVMALRGTFLVGGRPADDDLVRRFVLCAAESGIDIFRLHDPLNDIDDLVGPAAAVREAGARAVRRASSTRDGARGRTTTCSSTPAASPTSAPTASCCTTPPARSTRPPRAS